MTIISPHIESIIIRQLDRQASEAELALLEDWLSQSAAHRETYQSLLLIWNESQTASLQHSFNTEAAWEKLSKRIQPQKTKVVHFRLWKRELAVAATLILVIGLPALYFISRITAEPIAWQSVTATGNQFVRLADGTQVSLRNGSTLRYPERFTSSSRDVTLEGEAYFEVLHEEGRPFRITTKQAVVTDLGTAFLLRTNDSTDQVVVTEGQVSLARKVRPAQQVLLLPGQKGEMNSNRLWKGETSSKNLLAWKEGTLQFEQTPLTEVAQDLSHYFGVRFQVTPDVPAQKILINVQFRQQPLEEVLEELRLITGLSFIQKGSVVEIVR